MGEKFIQFEKLPEFWAGNWQGEREPYSVDSSNPRRTGSMNNWILGREIGRPGAKNWQASGGKLTNNLNLEGREKLTNIIFQIWKGRNFGGESRRENLLIFTNFGQTFWPKKFQRSLKSSSTALLTALR